jgi:hypothetical protein
MTRYITTIIVITMMMVMIIAAANLYSAFHMAFIYIYSPNPHNPVQLVPVLSHFSDIEMEGPRG